MPDRKYKVVSLFTGAMGLDLGLRKTGRFEILACVEKEPAFCDTIRANVRNGRLGESPLVLDADIKKLCPKELLDRLGLEEGEVDLLTGGPPCQSFSTAGRRGTVQDPRGSLLWEFLRFVEALKPKVFLMENVRGLMSAAVRHRPISQRPEQGGPPLEQDEEPGSVVRLFSDDLLKLNSAAYRMDCFEVNAVNYGAPQLRERALFIGNRYNREIDFPNPTHGANDAGTGQMALFYGQLKPWRTLGDAILDLHEANPVLLDFSPRKKRYLSLVPPGGNWRHLPESLQLESLGKAYHAKGGRSGWWRKLSYELPCPTLVTMPNHASTALCHPEQIRALSVREYCRVQEFPDNWEVCGSPAQQYAQIGNAVPVRLGEVAGEVLARALDEILANGEAITGGATFPCRKIYIQSHVRTRQWYKDGEAVAWQDGEDNIGVLYSMPKKRRSWSVVEGR